MLRAISQNILKSPKEKPFICPSPGWDIFGEYFSKSDQPLQSRKEHFQAEKVRFFVQNELQKSWKSLSKLTQKPPRSHF